MYIGKCFGEENCSKRKREHLYYLRNGNHHSIKLQDYYDCFGEDSLDFKVIQVYENITNNELSSEEEKYIEMFNTYGSDIGCNSTKGGKGVKGLYQTKESISKMKATKRKGFDEKKYRLTVGETNGCHVLKEKQVKEIIQLFYEGKMTHQEIADRYGVTRQTISLIYGGKRWSYLKEVMDWLEYKNEHIKKENKTILSKDDVVKIKYLLSNSKISMSEIARMYNVHYETIRKIKIGIRHRDVIGGVI